MRKTSLPGDVMVVVEVEPGNVLPEPHEAGVDVDGGLPPASTRGVPLGPELRAAPAQGQALGARTFHKDDLTVLCTTSHAWSSIPCHSYGEGFVQLNNLQLFLVREYFEFLSTQVSSFLFWSPHKLDQTANRRSK